MQSKSSKTIFQLSYFFVGNMLHRVANTISRHARVFSTGLFGFTGIKVPYDCIMFAEVLFLSTSYSVEM